MTEEIIDRSVLADLRAIDEALVRDVVTIFADDAPRQIAALRAALATREARAVERAAHRLKGTASGVGAVALAAAAATLEHAARAGDLEKAAPGAAGLDAAFEAARIALERATA
jgi:HPt (histidine-containing phosphotransfer) domain-containing protein